MGGGNRFASNKEVLVWATFFFFLISLQCAGFLFAIDVCSFFLSLSVLTYAIFYIHISTPQL